MNKIRRPRPLSDQEFHLTKIVASYLHDRKLHVMFEDIVHSWRPLTAGDFQSSQLLPLLFALYTIDLPRGDNTTICQYFDDIAILAKSS